MQISNNKVLNTRNLEAGIFLIMGGAKTVQDYRSVGEDYKKRILLNDTVVLGASCAAMLGYRALSSRSNLLKDKCFKPAVEFVHKKYTKFRNTDFAKKHLVGKLDDLYHPIQKPLEMSKEIIGSCISNTLMVAAGLFGAIAGDYALTKTGYGIHKTKKLKEPQNTPTHLTQVEKFKKKNLDPVIDKKLQEEVFWRVMDFPAFNVLTSPFVGLQGLAITDDEKYSKQVKNASKYLLGNSLVPLFFFSLSSALTKKLKNIYRIPIMFTSLMVGTLTVRNILDRKLKPHS